MTRWFQAFTNPISIRLSTASCLAMLFLVISVYFWWSLLDAVVLQSFFRDHPGSEILIITLLMFNGFSCGFIHLRCIYTMHRRFQSDVIAVYTHYLHIDDGDGNVADPKEFAPDDRDDREVEDVVNRALSMSDENTAECRCRCNETMCYPFKAFMELLLPMAIESGPDIVEHVQACRIMVCQWFMMFLYYEGCHALSDNSKMQKCGVVEHRHSKSC